MSWGSRIVGLRWACGGPGVGQWWARGGQATVRTFGKPIGYGHIKACVLDSDISRSGTQHAVLDIVSSTLPAVIMLNFGFYCPGTATAGAPLGHHWGTAGAPLGHRNRPEPSGTVRNQEWTRSGPGGDQEWTRSGGGPEGCLVDKSQAPSVHPDVEPMANKLEHIGTYSNAA